MKTVPYFYRAIEKHRLAEVEISHAVDDFDQPFRRAGTGPVLCAGHPSDPNR